MAGRGCMLSYGAWGAGEPAKKYIRIYCDGTTFGIDDFKELRVYGSKARGWRGRQDKGHLRELEVFGFSATLFGRGRLAHSAG